jgi:hypothetical protein
VLFYNYNTNGVFGYSCYVYNTNISTAVIYRIPVQRPRCRHPVLAGFGANYKLWCAVRAGNKCPGASKLIVRTFTDGDVGGSHLLSHAVLTHQSGQFMVSVE